MFRSRRNTLVRRLWKSKVLHKNETSCSNEMVNRLNSHMMTQSPLLNGPGDEDAEHVKAVSQSMLKRLKERQLDVLIQAIESRGGDTTDCVLLPKDTLRIGRRGSISPHVLCCQIWRWPELSDEQCLKRLPCCSAVAADPTSVCCNPYHWSLRVPESPPPYYKTMSTSSQRVFSKDVNVVDGEDSPISLETGGPTPLRISEDGSGSNSRRRPFWCNIAYWEHRQRVGRLFTVFDDSVNVFQELPHGDGMCLNILQVVTDTESVKRTREKIGLGLTLSREPDGLWMYNRSEVPIFVNSPTLDMPDSPILVVQKVQPGYSLRIFDYNLSEIMKRTRDPQFLDGPYDPNSIRISFAKGWGPNYSRQFITSCPCWIEVLLAVNR